MKKPCNLLNLQCVLSESEKYSSHCSRKLFYTGVFVRMERPFLVAEGHDTLFGLSLQHQLISNGDCKLQDSKQERKKKIIYIAKQLKVKGIKNALLTTYLFSQLYLPSASATHVEGCIRREKQLESINPQSIIAIMLFNWLILYCHRNPHFCDFWLSNSGIQWPYNCFHR